MKNILVFCLLVLSVGASADVDPLLEPKTLYNCEVPSEREDGTAFDWATEGKDIRFYWGYTPGQYQYTETRPNCQWIIDNTAIAGKTIYMVETAVDTDGRESAYNAEKAHTVSLGVHKPRAPKPGDFSPYTGN